MTTEDNVDDLVEATEVLGLDRVAYEAMEPMNDLNIRWNDLTNDAIAVLFVNKYFTTASGSKTIMYYVEEERFYQFTGVYWKQLSKSAQELLQMFPNDGSSQQQFVVHLWSAFKAVEKDMTEEEADKIRKRISALEGGAFQTPKISV